MISTESSGRSFAAITNYLTLGRDGASPERVEWSTVRNLPAAEPAIAVRLMEATAGQNQRIEKPVFHLTINLPPEERLSREEMKLVIDQTLEDLRLSDRQAFIVEHNDRDHQHVHIVVNRVHPETLRAWDRWRSKTRANESLDRQSKRLGLRLVERGDGQGPGKPEGSRALRPFAELVRDVARDAMREAKSWDELSAALRKEGLRAQAKGRGLIVTDGHEYAKSSSIDRALSRGKLETKFGETLQQYRDRAQPADFVRQAPLRKRSAGAPSGENRLASLQAEERALREELSQRSTATAKRVADATQKAQTIELEAESFKRQSSLYLRAAFETPRTARARLERQIADEGLASTLKQLSKKPKAFGKLRGKPGLVLRSRERVTAIESAHRAAYARQEQVKRERALTRAKVQLARNQDRQRRALEAVPFLERRVHRIREDIMRSEHPRLAKLLDRAKALKALEDKMRRIDDALEGARNGLFGLRRAEAELGRTRSRLAVERQAAIDSGSKAYVDPEAVVNRAETLFQRSGEAGQSVGQAIAESADGLHMRPGRVFGPRKGARAAVRTFRVRLHQYIEEKGVEPKQLETYLQYKGREDEWRSRAKELEKAREALEPSFDRARRRLTAEVRTLGRDRAVAAVPSHLRLTVELNTQREVLRGRGLGR